MVGRRRVEPVEWAGLIALLVPVVAAVVRAAATGWMPIGDAAYFTARSRDVFTQHWPLLGAWSSGSAVFGTAVNNLGPLQLYVLAPFTKVVPYLGTGIGSAVINAGALWCVWFSARRLFGPRRVLLVVAATLLLLATLGLSWLIDARQQFALVLPFYALLWLTAAMWAGVGAAVPIGLGVASLTVQTHFTYAYQAGIVTAAGVAAYAVTAVRRRDRATARVLVIGAAVTVACWIPPLVEQFAGTGNLAAVLGRGGSEGGGPGVGMALRIVAGGSLVPPFWLPGSIGDFLRPHVGVTVAAAATAFALWAAGAALVLVAGRVRRARAGAACAAAALVALLAGAAGAVLIPVSMFGLVQQNFYWVWPLGAFASVALAAGAWEALPAWLRRPVVGGRRLAELLLAGVATACCLLAAWPRYPVAAIAIDEREADRVGVPLRRELARAFAAPAFPDVVEVDLSRAFFGNDFPFVVVTELQRAGVEFRFPPGSRNLDRFGASRCAPPATLPRLFLVMARRPELEPGSRVLARVEAFTDAERTEMEELQERFGELLRGGSVALDLDAITTVLDPDLDDLLAVFTTPGAPAAGLSADVEEWRRWGFAEVPVPAREAYDRWVTLEQRSVTDYQTLLLAPPGVSAGAGGPEQDRGAGAAC